MIIGLLVLLLAFNMALGWAFIGPLGLAWGIGEMAWYDTWVEKGINLFYHVLPGALGWLMGAGFLMVSLLLFWAAVAVWRKGAGGPVN
jgi:hypothetical protein